MAYSSGGLIQAIDYNYFTWGGNTTGTYSGTITNLALVWGVGYGYKGYGQDVSLISAVSTSPLTTTITATQWAGLVYTLNRALGHQSGAGAQLATGSNIGITAGATIRAFSNVATAITTINTNANTRSASGTTITGSTLGTAIVFAAGNTSADTASFTRTVTFASANQARYFFNAGGYINFVLTATNNNGTLRGADLVTNWQTNQAGGSISGGASGGRTGSGGTVNTNSTTLGYYQLTTSNQAMQKITSANYRYEYNTDFTQVGVRTNATNVSGSGDNGAVLTFQFDVSLAGKIGTGNSGFNDAVNVTLNVRFDIVPPETTYLANTWGSITIA